MSDRHLSHLQLRQLLNGDLCVHDLRQAQLHLGVCGSCEGEIAVVLDDLRSQVAATDPVAAVPRKGSPPALAERLNDLRHRLDAERTHVGEVLQRVETAGEAPIEQLLKEDPDLCSWGLCEKLIDESRNLLSTSPQRAKVLILRALKVTERLDPRRYGEKILETGKFRGWAHLGNVRRVLGDFEGAEKALRRAEFHYWASDLDPLDEATLLQYRAALRRAQRRFDEALQLIDDAREICREVRETHREGRAVLARAIIDLCRGFPELAAAGFEECLPLLDASKEPKLPLLCHINQVICLTEAGRPQEAAELLPEAKRLAETVLPDPISQLRIRWMEARVAWGLGRLEEAEPAFRTLQELFLQANLPVDAALVTLDLASLLVGAGRTAETKELMLEMIPVFQAFQIQREALAALIVLQQAAATANLTLALVRNAAFSVRTATLDPSSAPPS